MNFYDAYSRLFIIDVSNGKVSKRFYGTDGCIKLNPVFTYQIGIDQSTKQSGMFIRSTAKNREGQPHIAFMLDIINNGLPKTEIYQLMLQEFLNNILTDEINISEVFIEVPLENSGYVYTRNLLIALKGFIKTLEESIPAFRRAAKFEVSPGVWRKHYLKDPRYKGRRSATEDLKYSALEETLIRHPQFKQYTDTFSKPPDSCDAVGILEGGLEEVYYDQALKLRRYTSTMQATVRSYEAFYDVVPHNLESVADFVMEISASVVDDAEEFIDERGVEVFVVDEYSKDLDKIVCGIVSQTNAVCLILFEFKKEKYLDLLKWTQNIRKGKHESYCCVAWRSRVDSKKDYLGGAPSFAEMSDLFDDFDIDTDEFEEDY